MCRHYEKRDGAWTGEISQPFPFEYWHFIGQFNIQSDEQRRRSKQT